MFFYRVILLLSLLGLGSCKKDSLGTHTSDNIIVLGNHWSTDCTLGYNVIKEFNSFGPKFKGSRVFIIPNSDGFQLYSETLASKSEFDEIDRFVDEWMWEQWQGKAKILDSKND